MSEDIISHKTEMTRYTVAYSTGYREGGLVRMHEEGRKHGLENMASKIYWQPLIIRRRKNIRTRLFHSSYFTLQKPTGTSTGGYQYSV